MKIPERLCNRLFRWALSIIGSRDPDAVIGGQDDPYLKRWWVIPRNPLLNIYLHVFLRDDDDRYLHDHPWINLSVLLVGDYREVVFREPRMTRKFAREFDCLVGGERGITREAGDLVFRMPRHAHRILLRSDRVVTLFITGPRVRKWGFYTSRGWKYWRDCVRPDDPGKLVEGL